MACCCQGVFKLLGGGKSRPGAAGAPDTRQVNDEYEFDSAKLGQGAYGSVCKAKQKIRRGAVRAIKKIALASEDARRLDSEIKLLKMMDHPNIIKYYEKFTDTKFIYIVMELCEGGELFDKIIEVQQFTEKKAAVLMQQMVSPIFYMHQRRVTHRDLKPENFLFTLKKASIEKNELKLIDFGLAAEVPAGSVLRSKAGTPYYVAPEVLKGSYTEVADVWSLGVILYVLLCGSPPFFGENDKEILSKVKSAKWRFEPGEWNGVSDDAKELIRKMLTLDYKKRITAARAIEDPWLVKKAPNSRGNLREMGGVVDRLRAFRSANRLKKAAMHVIAKQMPAEKIQHLKEMFQAMDVNKDGMLSAEELKAGIQAGGMIDIPIDLQAIFDDIDSDKSGVIDYTEFLTAALDKRQYMQRDVCWTAFNVFDKDHSGSISIEELEEVFKQEDIQGLLGDKSTQELLAEVDKNGDGEIDFEEFMAMFREASPSGFDEEARRRRSSGKSCENCTVL